MKETSYLITLKLALTLKTENIKVRKVEHSKSSNNEQNVQRTF